ncbi:3-ketoacyl-ACP reductase [Campylobacter hepaticus]|uniref:3-ketoacyl-ACP reductase n=1 Tax=Campylobacter hepaticus TaxID=1813019 RepID=A0A424YZT3_9BACT|nr:3-ketoacyl-ACP reductase [Campylobacter hepaticus]MPV54633.1 3-ketoacyl-ACP reductase [Campylobacter hepaticus]MPV62648.1 3-ketoacyl-ACP reductase [Campylobacter hepaticus]MPV77629.1 3-ketoacyl-ACP reductase [Campylobacter hepaticus]MPV79387.1 3-ketoacyl-ACP reductase [Campylobacter hepaticus]
MKLYFNLFAFFIRNLLRFQFLKI